LNDVAIATAGLVKSSPRFPACKAFILEVLARIGIDGWEVSILFCDDSFIEELNRRYRGIEAATDVLSFSQTDAELPRQGEKTDTELAGDIIISLETMRRNAERERVSEDQELKRLLIHGLLHLTGMDHETERSDMLVKQEKLLLDFNKEKIV
jgi:probable rRNA maturation factor